MRHFNKESYDYHFEKKYIAGLVLTGSDAKSLRVQNVQFENSHVDVINGQPILMNLHIPVYKYSQSQTVDTTRDRQLLLSTKEISELQSWRRQKYMLIPVAIFTQGPWFKVEIGVGRKFRKYEKRQKLMKRESEQSIR